MKKFFSPLALFALVFSLTACQDDFPLQEMSEAHDAISKAYEVQAQQYAMELVKQAETDLYASHNACSEANLTSAKDLAISAKQNAEAAISSAMPQAASNSLANAKAKYEEAKKIGAEDYAKEEMALASENIAKAENLNKSGNYAGSVAASDAAIESIDTAQAKTAAQTTDLASKLKTLKSDLSSLKKQDKDGQYEADLGTISDLISDGEKALKEKNVTEAAANVNDASERIDNIKSSMLSARVQTAREDIAGIRDQGVENATGTLLTDAEKLLEKGETAINEKNWKAADTNIKQAERKITQAKPIAVRAVNAAKELEEQKAREAAEAEAAAKRAEEERIAAQKAEEERALAEERAAIKEAAAARTAAKRASSTKYQEKAEPRRQDQGAAAKGGSVYVVQKGDCLWKISQKMYRNSSLWPRIYMANRDKIKDPDLIYPGQRLVIPGISQGKDAGSVEPRRDSRSYRSERDSSYYNYESDYLERRTYERDSRLEERRRINDEDANRDERIDNSDILDGGSYAPKDRDSKSNTNKYDDDYSSSDSSGKKDSFADDDDYNSGNKSSGSQSQINRVTGEDDQLPEGIFRENQ